ncbi:MAG: hypothetical protein I8H91_10255 [Burkholderiales bacterium]|jgi:hypothetical protein|nr:hypothetical protein [Burkholderiales bacterium]
MWQELLERFEKQPPARVMARIALEQAMPAALVVYDPDLAQVIDLLASAAAQIS